MPYESEDEPLDDVKKLKKKLAELANDEGDKEIESWYSELKRGFSGNEDEKKDDKHEAVKPAGQAFGAPARSAPKAAPSSPRNAAEPQLYVIDDEKPPTAPEARKPATKPENKPPMPAEKTAEEMPAEAPREAEGVNDEDAKTPEKKEAPGNVCGSKKTEESAGQKTEAVEKAQGTDEEDKEEEPKEIIRQPSEDMMETDIDKLLALIRDKKKLKAIDAANALNVPESKIEEWSAILEKTGMITVHYPPIGKPTLMFGKPEKGVKREKRRKNNKEL